MPFAAINKGDQIYYEERAPITRPVPTLVLLHGFPMDGRIWQHQLENLSDVARVIVPDLPGFGRSISTSAFSIASLADDVRELLRQLNALPCVLGGLSMGGYVALAFARKYAADLRGLILADTRADADSAEGKIGREKMIGMVRSGGPRAIADAMLPKVLAPTAAPEVVGRLREIMLACPGVTIEHALVAMRDREDATDVLGGLQIPILFIVGEQDVPSPPKVAEEMCRGARHGRLVVIPGAGHVSSMEKPADVTVGIADFLRSAAERAPGLA